jgi:two-component system, cell cycle sensor histidine kinase and response regulator CckA
VVGARCVAIDISERHELEEQLRRAKQMKAIGLMAGGVAHDLNNILSGVVTYPELILMELDPDNSLRPKIEAIRRSGLAAAGVVSDLLTVARGVAAVKRAEKSQ